MSIRVMTDVWDNGPEDRSELLVLLALADFADDHGRCWPSVETIGRKARMGERGVQKVLRRLEDAGWITTQVNGGRSGVNFYFIHNPEPCSPPNRRAEKPRTGVQKTPNGGSPEPSLTIT